MRTYKVTFEIVLKSDDTDWIERAIEENLEDGEEIEIEVGEMSLFDLEHWAQTLDYQADEADHAK